MESCRHFLRNCPAFVRLEQVGSHTFGESDEVAGIDISRINIRVYTSRLKALRRSISVGIPYKF